ncbi:SET domain-containing protein [Aequorivita sp. SDUM287046]|uniref:SET domain-containing protein n=1 Tax=Aequorivita aurantiaca TaxID=3053356 RepID=A0ABT8DLX4_9FLAO|nr:SET domain-containing protein [Aequorivita aurantiaca]MDN3724900.1 SET domain-containing protein [Aequorivita aurantiaca]
MIHPKTELKFISNQIGYGVVATEFIPAGTITWALDDLDREFTPSKLKKMNPLYQNILETYCYRNNKGNFVLCWDNGRYVNHSFKSNCISTAYDFEIAIRDIQAGEELTDDYGYLNVTEPFRGIDEGTRRKTVYPDDLLNHSEAWDKQLIKNFPKIVKVEQPLKSLITPKLWKDITAIAEGKKEMKSIKENHFFG